MTYLIVKAYDSNEWADGPEVAVIKLSEHLASRVGDFLTAHRLIKTARIGGITYLQGFDYTPAWIGWLEELEELDYAYEDGPVYLSDLSSLPELSKVYHDRPMEDSVYFRQDATRLVVNSEGEIQWRGYIKHTDTTINTYFFDANLILEYLHLSDWPE